MTRFTIKGWLMLPVALTLRIPFAILARTFEFVGDLSRAVSNRCDRIMRAMPKPEFNPAWVNAENDRIRKRAIAELTRGSQKA